MKTKEELLKFYGVEIGKKYKVTKIREEKYDAFLGEIFEIKDSFIFGFGVAFDKGGRQPSILNNFEYTEVKPSILDDVEREFLQKYVMDNPAFKREVAYITKHRVSSEGKEYIEITTTKYDGDFACFPCFKQDNMYKGMEIDKNYTPQELDLREDCF